MAPCRSKIPEIKAEHHAEIHINMHKLYSLLFFFYLESNWRHAMWWKQFSSASCLSENYKKVHIMHFLHYRASALILLLPQQDLSPTMLRTVVEITVYFILQFLHSELGHFDTSKSRQIEVSTGDGKFLLYLTPLADLWFTENFQLLQEIWDCSFWMRKQSSDSSAKAQEKLIILKKWQWE